MTKVLLTLSLLACAAGDGAQPILVNATEYQIAVRVSSQSDTLWRDVAPWQRAAIWTQLPDTLYINRQPSREYIPFVRLLMMGTPASCRAACGRRARS